MKTIHRLPPIMVKEQIDKKCAYYEESRTHSKLQEAILITKYEANPHLFVRKPEPDWVDPLYDSWIKKEREYYAKVRIVGTKEGYRLVYGRCRSKGTGPFSSVKKAKDWFFNGGR